MRSDKSLKSVLLAGAVAVAPLATLPAMPALAQAPAAMQSFAPLVEAAKPAVVGVVTEIDAVPEANGIQGFGNMPPEMEEFMRRFFPEERMPRPDMPGQARRGLGSGFIIDKSGVIVTNNHVVAGASKVNVVLDDGTEYEAEVVGTDDRIDIAVLRIETDRDLPTVEWGESDAVRVGDWALAIGNPLGLDGTVTAGIVSARGRDINSGPYDDYLQVDAAINQGNSGGPLFDLNGKVIGVNTAILSTSGGNIGLGFAIPAVQAQMIVADLLDDGKVERGWIGVSIQPVDRDIAESLGLEAAKGALVAEVMPDSPAKAAGLQPGDVILGFNGKDVNEVRDLTRAVAASEIDADAKIEIWRGDEARTLEIRPALLETASAEAPAPAAGPANLDLPDLGLGLESTERGVAVASVEPGSAAAEQGIRPGDVILSVDRTEVPDSAAVTEAIETAKENKRENVLLLVERDGTRRFLTLSLTSA
ncbi:Do family serine endopeptidase [Rhodobacteraceae bacterium 2CG4]|uniref:Probable periplasmic serine endoprotease DegP-like n=1 Tax=Halovulum marinum TaxID=2662447 RepID=A0A6L5YWG9_9RHOB|nr:Do family serine endopeptidase [Halovulum marinum]MSU88723.1 Do family serine endopeptidase [Halovulum marinum]